MTDNYANEPQNIAELKANREASSKFWKPRDMLIAILRDIDKGIEPDVKGMVILFLNETDGSSCTKYKAAGTTYIETLGLIESCKFDIINDSVK